MRFEKVSAVQMIRECARCLNVLLALGVVCSFRGLCGVPFQLMGDARLAGGLHHNSNRDASKKGGNITKKQCQKAKFLKANF